jgi:hypothetical protein
MKNIYFTTDKPMFFKGQPIQTITDISYSAFCQNKNCLSVEYGKSEKGFYGLVKNKNRNSDYFFEAEKAIDLLKHKELKHHPELLQYLKEELSETGAAKYFYEIGEIDYSKPFCTLNYGKSDFIAQGNLAFRDGQYFIIQNEGKYTSFDSLNKKIVWSYQQDQIDKLYDLTKLENIDFGAKVSIIKFLLSINKLPEYAESKVFGDISKRKQKTDAQLHRAEFSLNNIVYDVFGVLLAEEIVEKKYRDTCFSSTEDSSVKKAFLDIDKKQIYMVHSKSNIFNYTNLTDAFVFENKQFIANIANSLALPQADYYFGIYIEDLIKNNLNLEVENYEGISYCVQGRKILDHQNWIVYLVENHKKNKNMFVVVDKSKAKEPFVFEDFSEALILIDEAAENSQVIMQLMHESYPNGFQTI